MRRTDEDIRLREIALGVVDGLIPLVEEGPDGRVNRPLLDALGQDLLPEIFPENVGGKLHGSVSARALCVIRECLGQHLPPAETALALQGLGGYPILLHATAAPMERWVPAVAAGRAVAGFALTEPEAGSDAAAISTSANRTDDGWVISGEKTWISNAPDADVYTVFARTGEEGSRGVSAFVVPGDSPGLTGDSLDMVAPHALGRIRLEEVTVPPDALLGEENRGFRVAMTTLDLFRPSVGAFAVGLAQAALDATLEHTASREAFGGTLGDLQAIQHGVADMAVDIETARLLVFEAADEYDNGGPDVTRLSAMAKLHATEMASRVVDKAIQFHGARALERGHLLEELYREVRAPRIYEGASEVQRTIIARELLSSERTRE
ncbi:MAG: acyl-CoA dehydrogenase [Acidimicrobiia bacterium]|nr:acyl-CoA dehydrogenase [Acidimicrobiia bacterium]